MANLAPQLTESLLSGTLDNTITATDTTIVATFNRAPQTDTKLFVIEKDSSNYEIILAGSISLSGATATMTSCIRGLTLTGRNLSAGTGLRHTGGAAIGTVNVAQLFNIAALWQAGTNGSGAVDFRVGRDINEDITLYAQNAAANTPFMRYDNTNSKWIFSNDGISTTDVGGGTGTITAGDGIDITAGVVDLDIRADRGLVITSTELDVLLEASEGLKTGAAGLAIDKTQTFTWAAIHTFSAGIGTAAQNAIEISPFGASAGNTGEQRFLELAAGGTNYVGFKAADALAGNVIWTLPDADGSVGQALQTDGSNVLSWTSLSLIDSTTSDVAVSSTTTETDLLQISVPAGTLGTNRAVTARIYLDTLSIASGQTATFRLKYGSTTVATLVISSAPLVISTKGYVDCMLIASGATGTQEGSIQTITTTDASIDATGTTNRVNAHMGADFGSSSEDSTGALNLTVSVQFSASAANNETTKRHGIVYKIT